MRRNSMLWKANAIVFIGSFCVMVIELIAARMMAPSIGVSLYTWTSIIGVILAGIALGNYLGGKFADKYPSPRVLVGIFILGSLLTVVILPLIKMLSEHGNWFAAWPLMINFTLRTLIIFFLPALVLSMVSPTVIKLALADLGKTGGVVGSIYAVSTAGAILGTFMTGFYFILWFGTRMLVWGVAGILMLMGIFILISWKIPAAEKKLVNVISWAVVLLVLGSGTLFYFGAGNLWRVSYDEESNYYTINVYDDPGNVKALALDHLIHSYVILDDPLYLKYDYLKIFTEIIGYNAGDNAAPRLLHLGGGGYSLPRYMETVYPRSVNEVVEIDPAVTRIAHEKLGLSANTSITTYNLDARLFLKQKLGQDKYDFVIGDVFNDFSTPYHLTTVEFDQLISGQLKPDGIYMVNIIGDFQTGRYMPSFIRTLLQVFQNVFIVGPTDDWEHAGINTWVLVATDRVFDPADYRKMVGQNNAVTVVGYAYGGAKLEQYLAASNAMLLTDDHAPTDILVSELNRKR
jgi:spermidine synthase